MNRKLYDLTNPQMNIWATEQYYNNTAVNNVGGTVLLKAKLNRYDKILIFCKKLLPMF